jgi:hypothetical protein
MIRLLLLSGAILLLVGWYAIQPSTQNTEPTTPPLATEKVRGLNFVAPPEPFSNNPMTDVKSVGADWIAVIPYAYTWGGQPIVRYNVSGRQWWGERPEGCAKTVDLAKEKGLKVMLKPQVYVPGSWTGALDYSAEDWAIWEKAYEDYILPMAEMAQEKNVDLFCIGTEFKIGVQKREQFWRDLTKKVRARFDGKLVYAANWDEYEIVPFWDAVDYIGVNAYFPLSDEETPNVKSLQKAWKPILNQLRSFAQTQNRPVLFTEFGYLSVDKCAHKTWELEKNIRSRSINEQAQANALDALFATFWNEPFWAGGFLWKWFPNRRGHEGYFDRDYTPQGKQAEVTLKHWYQQ